MAKADESAPSPRLALTPAEAAQAIGCSRDVFDKHIGLELRWVRRGRLKFVAIAEDWLRPAACGIHARALVSVGSHNRDSAQSCCKVEGARQLCASSDVLVRDQEVPASLQEFARGAKPSSTDHGALLEELWL